MWEFRHQWCTNSCTALLLLPLLLFISLSFFLPTVAAFYIYIPGLSPSSTATYSRRGCGGQKVIFSGDHYPFLSTPCLDLPGPTPIPPFPPPFLGSFPFALKRSSASRCSDNRSGVTVPRPNPQTCCHGNWAPPNGTIHRPSHET